MAGVDRDRLAEPRQVAGRVVDADAHADEVVLKAVDGGVEPADQLAGRARLRGAADDVERHAVDVRQQPPDAAAVRAPGRARRRASAAGAASPSPAAASRSVTATMLPCISGGKIGLTACSTARAPSPRVSR